MKEAIQEIEQELEERLAYFRREGKLLEASVLSKEPGMILKCFRNRLLQGN